MTTTLTNNLEQLKSAYTKQAHLSVNNRDGVRGINKSQLVDFLSSRGWTPSVARALSKEDVVNAAWDIAQMDIQAQAEITKLEEEAHAEQVLSDWSSTNLPLVIESLVAQLRDTQVQLNRQNETLMGKCKTIEGMLYEMEWHYQETKARVHRLGALARLERFLEGCLSSRDKTVSDIRGCFDVKADLDSLLRGLTGNSLLGGITGDREEARRDGEVYEFRLGQATLAAFDRGMAAKREEGADKIAWASRIYIL